RRQDAEVNEAMAVEASNQLRDARDDLWAALYASRARQLQSAWEENDVGRVRELLREQSPTSGVRDFRNFEWHYFDRLAHAELSVRPPDPAYTDPALAGRYGVQYHLSPDAAYLAVYVPATQADAERTGVLGRIDVRDPGAGVLLRTIPVSRPPGGPANPRGVVVQFTTDGGCLSVWEPATGRSGKAEPAVTHWWLFDTATGRERVPQRDLPQGVFGPVPSPDGTLVATWTGTPTGEAPFRIKLLEAVTLKPVRTFDSDLPGSYYGFEFRAGGKHVAMLVDMPTAEGRDAIVALQ